MHLKHRRFLGQTASCKCVRTEHFGKYLTLGKFKINLQFRSHIRRNVRNLHNSPSIFSIVTFTRWRWVRHVSRMGEKIYEHIILVAKFLGKRLLRTANKRWENDTNTVLMGILRENGRSTIKNATYSILISCLSRKWYIYMTDIVFHTVLDKYVNIKVEWSVCSIVFTWPTSLSSLDSGVAKFVVGLQIIIKFLNCLLTSLFLRNSNLPER